MYSRDQKGQKDLTGQTPYSSSTPEAVSKGARKRSRPGSDDTPPSAKRVAKKPRAHDVGSYVAATDPLARAIVLEGYPEQTASSEQLTLLRGVLVDELAGIQESPPPRFTGTAVLRKEP